MSARESISAYRLTPRERRLWLAYVRRLRARLSATHHIVVRTCRIPDAGDCELIRLGRGRFVWRIRIASDQGFESRLDSLIHEYAHALADFRDGEDEHDPAWGVAYSRVYREVVKIGEEIEREEATGRRRR